jgi:hypothetical protein
MTVISTKPKKYNLKSSEILWLLDNQITSGRLRQIARANNIGFLEADSMTVDGSEPEKFTRWFCRADIPKIIEHCKSLKKAVNNGDLVLAEKMKKIA